jgi:hypothetical protein
MRGLARMFLLYRDIAEEQKRAGQAPHLHFSHKVLTLGPALHYNHELGYFVQIHSKRVAPVYRQVF